MNFTLSSSKTSLQHRHSPGCLLCSQIGSDLRNGRRKKNLHKSEIWYERNGKRMILSFFIFSSHFRWFNAKKIIYLSLHVSILKLKLSACLLSSTWVLSYNFKYFFFVVVESSYECGWCRPSSCEIKKLFSPSSRTVNFSQLESLELPQCLRLETRKQTRVGEH